MDPEPLARVPTGIDGFDFIANGGLPAGRPTLLAGTPGTGKTVFGLQFLHAGATRFGERGVYVCFEESPKDLRQAAASLGWDLSSLEEEGDIVFVDAVPRGEIPTVVTGGFDLTALISRVVAAVERIGAKRIVVDAVSTLFSYLPEPSSIRWEMFRLRDAIRRSGATAVITAERDHDEHRLVRHGVEAFVADNVVVLRNRRDETQRQRTVAIAKFRTANHQQGEFPFTINAKTGIVVVPLSAMVLEQSTPERRLSTGVDELDEIFGGGVFEQSSLLVSGATGTGKTLTACHFMEALENDERGIFFGFEESRTQILRDAEGWGLDLAGLEAAGRLRIVCDYPEIRGLEDHIVVMRRHIDEFGPDRVAVDSLSSLQRISNLRAFREFTLAFLSAVKEVGGTTLFTATAPAPFAPTGSPPQTHVSSITDGILLLRYLEIPGEIQRALAVLKMRGTAHDTSVRLFTIAGDGMRVGEPATEFAGMLDAEATVPTD